MRELFEETGLWGRAVRELYDGCWEVETDPLAVVHIGIDPEHAADEQRLRGVAWFTFEEMQHDRQVRLVIAALAQS